MTIAEAAVGAGESLSLKLTDKLYLYTKIGYSFSGGDSEEKFP